MGSSQSSPALTHVEALSLYSSEIDFAATKLGILGRPDHVRALAILAANVHALAVSGAQESEAAVRAENEAALGELKDLQGLFKELRAELKELRREKAERERFPEVTPPSWPDWARDRVMSQVTITFDLRDRLRILLGSTVAIWVRTHCEWRPGRMESKTDIIVRPLVALAQGEECATASPRDVGTL